ncbi:WSCD family member AAEL009094 [Nilaparvata lugens]|uniref:WSCD family member AAEL009094 n=1 Tax=Nilaparvata lugens TaxID=108931 RepID=UPI00193E0499|nr:WSCD family member AAEL009094 [Nilaparvata lugens]
MIRGRLCALGLLITIYLVGVLLLSTVTLQNQHKSDWIGGEADGWRGGAEVVHWCRPLHFLTPSSAHSTPRPVIALASFPGSGNTWLRYLLQQATGVYTGSVYKDYGLLRNGFPGESWSNSSVSVVKTHEWGVQARAHFGRAVLLVRAPAHAIHAEFNRQSGGHVGFASPHRYKRNRGRYWHQFVMEKLSSWKSMNLDWVRNFDGPTHVVLYENLVEDVETTLRKLIDFIQLPIDEKQIQCALERQEGIYRRKRRVFNLDPYTTSMKIMLQIEQEKVLQEIKSRIKTS